MYMYISHPRIRRNFKFSITLVIPYGNIEIEKSIRVGFMAKTKLSSFPPGGATVVKLRIRLDFVRVLIKKGGPAR